MLFDLKKWTYCLNIISAAAAINDKHGNCTHRLHALPLEDWAGFESCARFEHSKWVENLHEKAFCKGWVTKGSVELSMAVALQFNKCFKRMGSIWYAKVLRAAICSSIKRSRHVTWPISWNLFSLILIYFVHFAALKIYVYLKLRRIYEAKFFSCTLR